MIPEKQQNRVQSTVQGETVAMSIDTAAMAHVMGILTDIYADPELAIIREYATNALDSHVAAGQRRPIEVVTPTGLRPTLTIRDFGLGLSAGDIRDIYSQYGASTKRDSNDAVGMLGIGCKSALAYAPSFTLTANQAGVRIVVAVGRNAEGAGELTVVEQGETDEPDGVEVAIPARQNNQLESKAREFFSYWAPGTVLLNGEEPAPVNGFELSDDFTLVTVPRYSGAPRLRVVMGNVAYPVPRSWVESSALMKRVPMTTLIVARVPIGTVQFAPSREQLADHPSTRAALDGIAVNFERALTAHVERHIGRAKSKPEAARAFIELRGVLGASLVDGTRPTFKGAPMPTKVATPGPSSKAAYFRVNAAQVSYSARKNVGGRPYDAVESVDFETAMRSLWVLGYTNETWTKTQRDKLLAYAEHTLKLSPSDNRGIILWHRDSVPMADWLGEVKRIKWEDVRAWRDPSAPTAANGGRVTGAYYSMPPRTNGEGETQNSYWGDHAASELVGVGTIYFAVSGAESRGLHMRRMKMLTNAEPGAACVILPSTREAKFRRDFPHAQEYEPALAALPEKWAAALTDAERRELSLAEAEAHSWLPMPFPEADDPLLVELSTPPSTRVRELRDEAHAWRRLGILPAELDGDEGVGAKLVEELAERYPLLATIASYSLSEPKAREHLLAYVNKVYADEFV